MAAPAQTLKPYELIQNLHTVLGTAPEHSIVSRTLHADHHVGVTLFAFSAGEFLSEHTAATAATLQIISGEAEIILGDDHIDASVGTWIYMQPKQPHSIVAKTDLVMLLTLLKQARGETNE